MHHFIAVFSRNADLHGPASDYEPSIPVEGSTSSSWRSTSGCFDCLFFETPNSFFDRAIKTDGRGLAFFDGYLWPITESGRAEIDDMRSAVASGGYNKVLSDFSGEFAACVFDEASRQLSVFVDSAGVCPLYYMLLPGNTVVFANRVELLERYCKLSGLNLSNDIDTMAYMATWGMIPAGRTYFNEIRSLGPSGAIIGTPDKISVLEDQFAFANGPAKALVDPLAPDFGALLAELRSNVRWVRKSSSARLGLSGGKDSRLVLAALIAEGVTGRVEFFTNGLSDHPDVIVASELASRFGLNHQVREPSSVVREVDAKRVYTQDVPRSMYLCEWLLTGFEPYAHGTCAGGPVMAGLTGENFRAAFDHHGHDTSGINDRQALMAFMTEKVWLDPANIAQRDIKDRHLRERISWCDRQLQSGVEPAQVPNIFYAEWQSYRRNHGNRKANGIINYTVNVIGGPKLINVSARMPAKERRHERLHYEMMKRASPDLAHHKFAAQSWEAELGAPAAPPVPYTAQAKQRTQAIDWRTRVHHELKPVIQSELFDVSTYSPIWDILDRQKVEAYLKRGDSAHLQRFCFFGALTVNAFLERRMRKKRLVNSYLKN